MDKNINQNKIKDTIEKLKEVDLFYDFKDAIKIIVNETSKPQADWDDSNLNCQGIRYQPEHYLEILHDCLESWEAGIYKSKDEYDLNLRELTVGTATIGSEEYKSEYCTDFYPDCDFEGLEFGVVNWNPVRIVKGSYCFGDQDDYEDYIKELNNLSFSCFHGLMPSEILSILSGEENN